MSVLKSGLFKICAIMTARARIRMFLKFQTKLHSKDCGYRILISFPDVVKILYFHLLKVADIIYLWVVKLWLSGVYYISAYVLVCHQKLNWYSGKKLQLLLLPLDGASATLLRQVFWLILFLTFLSSWKLVKVRLQ